MKMITVRLNLFVICIVRKTVLRHIHKNPELGIGSWTEANESTQGNRVHTLLWTQNWEEELIWERFFQTDEQFSFRKDYVENKEAERQEICGNCRGMNLLLLKPNYYTTKWFSKKLLAIEINEIEIKMNMCYMG